MNKKNSIILIVILFIISFSYFLFGYQYFNLRKYHYDEGITAYGASLVLNGGMLYSDYWSSEFPGQYYLLAAIFRLFGESVNVQRIFLAIILALLCCCAYIITRKIACARNAFLAFLFVAACLRIDLAYGKAVQTAMLFSVISCIFSINFIYTQKKNWLVTSGLVCGLVVLFRQDFGFYVFISIFSTILLYQIFFKTEEAVQRSYGKIFINSLHFVLGICVMVFPVVLYFLAKSAFYEMVSDTLFFPFKALMNEGMHSPKASLNVLPVYSVLCVFLLSLIAIFSGAKRTGQKKKKEYLSLFLISVLGICLLSYFWMYRCLSHLLYSSVMAIIVFIIWYDLFVNSKMKKLPSGYKNFIQIAMFLFSFYLLFYSIRPAILNSARKPGDGLELTRAKGFYDNSELAQSQAAAIKYIQMNTQPVEKIFVGNSSHNSVMVSDMMFYFLSGRLSATKYSRLDYETTKKERQRHIIEDLKRNNTAYIVLCSVFAESAKFYEGTLGSGVTDLDSFIRDNYMVEKYFGPYKILRRKI